MDSPAIEAAKLALMARWEWDEPRAYGWIRRSAMDARAPKDAVAELVTEVCETGSWGQLPERLAALKESRPRPPQQRRSAAAPTTINAAISAAERSMADVSRRSPTGFHRTPEATGDQSTRRAG